MHKTITFFITLLLCAISHAEEVEIGGLLLDNTITRQGKEFYRKFSQLWQDLPNSDGINVQIKELVIPRSGTKLTVNMNNQTVYITYMGRRQQPIEDSVETAMFILIEAMAQREFGHNNPDIANDGW